MKRDVLSKSFLLAAALGLMPRAANDNGCTARAALKKERGSGRPRPVSGDF
jgi:hypothetical protein